MNKVRLLRGNEDFQGELPYREWENLFCGFREIVNLDSYEDQLRDMIGVANDKSASLYEL